MAGLVFHKPKVAETLRFLDAHGLDVWAKLDAGTEEYYRLVDRTDGGFLVTTPLGQRTARRLVAARQAAIGEHVEHWKPEDHPGLTDILCTLAEDSFGYPQNEIRVSTKPHTEH